MNQKRYHVTVVEEGAGATGEVSLEEQLEALKQQRATHQRNLNKLQETAAMYGIDVPLHISNQIDNAIAEIQKLNLAIAKVEAELEGGK